MRRATLSAMVIAAALFFFGAILHAGFGVGPLHEPQIIPAAIVETICGLALLFAVKLLLVRRCWTAAIIANVIALAEVVLEIVVRTALAGPHTASNHARPYFPDGYVYTIGDDLYHGSVLAFLTIGLLILSFKRSAILTNEQQSEREATNPTL
jgi:hypothetical protein